MNVSRELAEVCKNLRMLGDNELAEEALCAYAALTDTEDPHVDLSYSYIMRKLRKGDKDRCRQFQEVFKKSFDEGLFEGLEDPVNIALMAALESIDFRREDA